MEEFVFRGITCHSECFPRKQKANVTQEELQLKTPAFQDARLLIQVHAEI